MVVPCDFHTHTHHLGCADATMKIPAMVEEACRLGVRRLGITDHLNVLGKVPLHHEIRRDLEALDHPGVDVWLGVELNFLCCDGDFAYSAAVRDEVGFQFAIGGIHATYCESYDPGKIVDIQHRHHLATCANPLVDVLVHPYWFSRHEFTRQGWPWFDSIRLVPERYARELGQAARETGTAIEINGCANLVNASNPPGYVDAYADYLAAVAAEGCRFALGSDAHAIGRMATAADTWRLAERIGLTEERIWRPSCAPFREV